MKAEKLSTGKKQYVAPKLVERGDIETITQAGGKKLGLGDSFFLITPDNPIMDLSS